MHSASLMAFCAETAPLLGSSQVLMQEGKQRSRTQLVHA